MHVQLVGLKVKAADHMLQFFQFIVDTVNTWSQFVLMTLVSLINLIRLIPTFTSYTFALFAWLPQPFALYAVLGLTLTVLLFVVGRQT